MLAGGVIALVGWSLLVGGCAEEGPTAPGAYEDHGESADLIEEADDKSDGVNSSFDEHLVMSDALFLDVPEAIEADALQAFFEDTPYGKRSWLADEEIQGEPVSSVLSRVARDHALSPVLLLTRMQVEASLVSKTDRPSQHRIDRAFGCGCYDGQDCFSNALGFENQVNCAAETLRKLYDQSADGSGQWRLGKQRKTLDGRYITPRSHATAALYAYTPWVLPKRGGNWLVWNITKKFKRHLGLVESFVGGGCDGTQECVFMEGTQPAFCFHEIASIPGPSQCTLMCEGTCPDLQGWPTTFCAEFANVNTGLCVQKASARNRWCADVPGAHQVEAPRFIGSSGASYATALVCGPESLTAP